MVEREGITFETAGRLGALKRNSLYGNPGTPEGRKRGGFVSCLAFKSNPEFAEMVGFKLRKMISIPKKTALLAEFIGIVIGDGSITNYQVRVYFNSKTDGSYAVFVKDMVKQLFNIEASVKLRPKNTLELVISSVSLVSLLTKLGVKKGNKISQQVDIPEWILNNHEYSRACLRGLMDTDGGIYFHNHTTKGIKYRNMGLCFTSRSKPLLDSATRMLSEVGIEAKNDLRERVLVYNKAGIDKYMDLVGSHNPNLLVRFRSYKNAK